jgi:hypothetical protein
MSKQTSPLNVRQALMILIGRGWVGKDLLYVLQKFSLNIFSYAMECGRLALFKINFYKNFFLLICIFEFSTNEQVSLI